MALTKSLSFSLGRKRVLISNNSCDLEHFCADFDSLEHFCSDFDSFTPLKRRCSGEELLFDEKLSIKNLSSSSLLEALPQELLIKVICGVNHDDLKQLVSVSKTVRDATSIAEKSHFAFSTPSKTKAFTDSIGLLNKPMDFDELEAPNAPKQARKLNRPRISKKKLDNLSIALFSDEDDEQVQRWPRRSLFMETDS